MQPRKGRTKQPETSRQAEESGMPVAAAVACAQRVMADIHREFIEPRDLEIAALKQRISELEAALK